MFCRILDNVVGDTKSATGANFFTLGPTDKF